jgi:DNA primase
LADRSSATTEGRGREAAILLTLLRHPVLLNRHADTLAELELQQPDLDELRSALLSAWAANANEESAAQAVEEWACSSAGRAAIATLEKAPHVNALSFTQAEAALAEAEQGLNEALERQIATTVMRREIDEIADALTNGNDGGSAREIRLREAMLRAERLSGSGPADETDDERALADALRNAISNQIWVKRRR